MRQFAQSGLRNCQPLVTCVLMVSLALGAPRTVSASASTDSEATVALVGDIIFQRPTLKDTAEQMGPILENVRGADVAYGNFESAGFALESFSGAPRDPGPGPVVLSPQSAIDELRQMGFDVLSTANNHGYDWFESGVLATASTLNDAGFVIAGSGRTLAEARKYALHQVGGTRLALISTTTSLPPEGRAIDPNPTYPQGRAGLSTLRLVSDEYPLGRDTEREIDRMGADNVRVHEEDRAALLAEVSAAKAGSDIVILSMHAHQGSPVDPTLPATYQKEIARAAIDSGADIVVMHGPHQLRGIEKYNDKAIFYSLGNFMIMLPDPILNPKPMIIPEGSIFTQRAYFESAVVTVRFAGGLIQEIQLRPIELRETGELATHGTPRLATGEAAQQILEKIQVLSKQLQTHMEIDAGFGVIKFNDIKH